MELEAEIGMLGKILSEIDAIKRNHHLTSDEMITKIYGGTMETTAAALKSS